MNDSFSDPKSEGLYAFLRGELPSSDPQVPAEEAAVAASLRAAAEDIQADPQFQVSLGAQLAETAQSLQPPPRHRFPYLGRVFAWAAAAVLLFLVLAWAIRNALPNPPTAGPAGLPDQTLTLQPGVATPLPAQGTTLPTYTPAATPTSEPNVYSSPMFPGVDLVLQAEFPQSPAQAAVFEQLPLNPLSLESARSIASQLGVDGPVFLGPSAPGGTSYIVTDGIGRVTFWNSPQNFTYLAQPISPYFGTQDLPPFEEQSAQAEAFLKSHNLLNDPYQIETPQRGPGTVNFLQLLDGYPVRYSLNDALWTQVFLGGQGEVRRVEYRRGNFNSLGSFPIRTAQDAWSLVIGAQESRAGVETSSVSQQLYGDRQVWQREYPMGQPVELFGYLEVLQPVEPGGAPFVSFNGFPVADASPELVQAAASNQLMQVLGQIQPGDQGQPTLQVEGWQVSPFAAQIVEGVIARADGEAYLAAEGQNLLVPDLPSNFPEGVPAVFEGAILEQPEPTLEWWNITIGAQGGGGGGGGSTWVELNLDPASSPPSPTVTPAPPPVSLGQRLEGERGSPFITVYQYDDGTGKIDASLFLDPSPAFPEGLTLSLEGPGLAGIEAYHRLQLYVWGTITDIPGDSPPVLNLERYEPVNPDVIPQVWQGTAEWITAEGQPAILFTAQTGEQYVLDTSINQTSENMGIASGDKVVVEGAAYPYQTFGGYLLISNSIAYSVQALSDPGAIQPQMMEPPVLHEPGPNAPRGRSVIEKIELVYLIAQYQSPPTSSDNPLVYVQPVWRFTGHDAKGDPFEILVQALADEYLK